MHHPSNKPNCDYPTPDWQLFSMMSELSPIRRQQAKARHMRRWGHVFATKVHLHHADYLREYERSL